MINVYDKNTTLATLRSTALETPDNAGRAWAGIQHGELADSILDEIKMRGWTAGEMAFSVAAKGAALCGAIAIGGSGITMPEGVELSVGFLHSNNRRKATRLYVGGNVAICHNGLTTGQVVLAKKHTSGFDLAEELEKGFDRYVVAAAGLGQTVARLQGTKINATKASDLIAAAGKAGYMPPTRLWDVSREYYAPRHPEHGTGTGWALLNAFTEIVKKNPAEKQMEQIDGFRQLVLAA